ncbi:MAG: sigma-70 family RNA polymerase sigma factor [Planctomycetota bacterium]
MVSTLLPPATREPVLRELVTLIATGHEGALDGLHRLTHDRLHRIGMRMLGSWDLAEEVVSEVFTQVWRRAHTYNAARGTVNAWLNTILRNRAIDRLRGGRRDLTPLDELASGLFPPDSGSTPLQNTEDLEDASQVRRAVRGLPDSQRTAIELAFFQGMSHSEVADKLGAPLGTIKTRIRSGLLTIRQGLGLG